MMTIKFYLYVRLSESNRNFITEHVKTVKIPGFSSFFLPKLSNSRYSGNPVYTT